MNILLTGATGFLGFRTLELLANDSNINSIIATGRTLKNIHEYRHPKINYQLGNLAEKKFVESLFDKPIDIIIHAAALSSPWGIKEQFYKSNVLPTEILIEFARKNRIKRFVFISSPSIYFNKKDRYQIKESDPLPKEFINEYAKTKRDAELLLEKSQIPYIILRPRALTGRGDTIIMPRLIRAYKEGKLRVIGDGKNKVDITSVANVALAIRLAIFSEEKALNQVYNISNGNPIELWKAIEMVLLKMEMTPPSKKIPYYVVVNIARMMELKSRLTNMKEPPLTCYGVGTLAKNFTMDISKARELLNYQPIVTNEEAINEFVNWYKNL